MPGYTEHREHVYTCIGAQFLPTTSIGAINQILWYTNYVCVHVVVVLILCVDNEVQCIMYVVLLHRY